MVCAPFRPAVASLLITSRRERRTSEVSLNMSTCFQRTPQSSSWMQIALATVNGSPEPQAQPLPNQRSQIWFDSPRRHMPSTVFLIALTDPPSTTRTHDGIIARRARDVVGEHPPYRCQIARIARRARILMSAVDMGS